MNDIGNKLQQVLDVVAGNKEFKFSISIDTETIMYIGITALAVGFILIMFAKKI